MTTNDAHALRDRILEVLFDRLRASENSLTADAGVRNQLAVQVDWILDRTCDRLGHPFGMTRFSAPPPHGSGVGETRARQNIHPVDSLIAATELFDVALSAINADPAVEVDAGELARALNASIMSAVVPASVGYVNVLLERLAVAHSEERLSISRELHDRVAHSIAAGLQRFELGGASDDANPQLKEGLDLFGNALDETRAIALDLRHAVGDKMLDEALRDYVNDLDDSGPPVVTTVTGTPYRLSTGVQEEAFIIIREAVHNARRHSQAAHIRVHSHWDRRSLTIAVIDNGRGFAHSTVRSGALGLVIAQERAELIGAELEIVPGLGTGTTLPDHSERHSTAMNGTSRTVVLIDDHSVFRQGIRALIEGHFRIVGEGGTSDAAWRLVGEHRPDILLLDVEIPGIPAEQTVSRIHHHYPGTAVVILTMHSDAVLERQLLRAGAAEFVTKNVDSEQLITALSRTTPPLGSPSDIVLDDDPGGTILTVREQEVLRMIAQAYSNRDIATMLSIAEGTVKRHTTNMYEKLGATSRIDAVRKAARLGLLS